MIIIPTKFFLLEKILFYKPYFHSHSFCYLDQRHPKYHPHHYLHSMGLMTTRDFENYFSLFTLMDSFVSAPDLLIYLRASVPTLVNQIQQRGREYEESIRLDYLKRLNERYEAWISTYDKGKLLIIDIDNNRFPESQEDLGKIIHSIDAEINGLF